MIKIVNIFILFFIILLLSTSIVSANDVFFKAKVVSINNFGINITENGKLPFQDLNLEILDTNIKGKIINIIYGKNTILSNSQLLNIGDTVVVENLKDFDNNNFYQIIDRYRLDAVIPLILFFFVVVIILSQLKGVGSILGMFISLGVIVSYIVPQILNGKNPMVISILGCLFIMVTTIYLAHGFSSKTSIAVISTFITLTGTALIASLFVKLTFLTGLSNDDVSSLRFGLATANIDFKGLLLGGILIGTLGVLDDVTTGLSASIFEIKKANPKINFIKLFSAGLSIGKEHISSLVNTLVLAYAGTSLPIFISIVLNPTHYPLWLILNDGLIIEEVVRTISGSIGLIAAVPLTTFLSTFYLTKMRRPTRSE